MKNSDPISKYFHSKDTTGAQQPAGDTWATGNTESRGNGDLMALMGHELRSPLSVIRLYVQMAKAAARCKLDTDTMGLLEKVDNQVTIMTSTIENVMDMSQIVSGKIVLRKECFDLSIMIHELFKEHFSGDNKHEWSLETEDSLYVYADRAKIGQVIYNLLSNAVKYSPTDSLIRILCQRNEQAIIVSVIDQGIGIATDDQKLLFNKFFRADCEKVNSQKGFGIGLFLVKEIICQHDGMVWVQSKKECGAAFSFSLAQSSGIENPANIFKSNSKHLSI
ncbi:sensor histidine kinase [Mucilaginibacter conchicola]|uniref:histidine kinase n=1 Tax=Mucilaginibacter conchicola TaxID=2303333 RepID=A0A372NM74_9SPHI|nr:HAMP domain-containing sensor histidine kinase [Mucilaginibacter conchicola]RFZ90041.1 sensor histidine kinase [Mucilaginibacter conchicola]